MLLQLRTAGTPLQTLPLVQEEEALQSAVEELKLQVTTVCCILPLLHQASLVKAATAE